MKNIFLFSFLLTVGMLANLHAQDDSEKKAHHGFLFGTNFINHEFPLTDEYGNNDVYTRAIEIGYIRGLNDHFNLLFPLQIGGATYPADELQLGSREFFGGLDVLAQALILKRNYMFSPYIVAGAGVEARFDRSEDVVGFGIPLGVGLDYNANENISVGVRGEYRLGMSNFDDNIQLNIGLYTLFGGKAKEEKITDLDGDGIDDIDDKCPAEAGTVALNGCPDNDGDGIANADDGCPDAAGTVENNGCPVSDSDGDGVADGDDKCPQDAGSAELDGCPDLDGDGVVDVEDACPDAAGYRSLNGCPDSDNDGVADSEDNCPNEQGTIGGCPDSDNDGLIDKEDTCPEVAGTKENNGCPGIKKEDQETLALAAQNIQFETAQAVLKSDSKSILDKIAEIMSRYPSHHVSISGHTDSIGSSGSNLSLSKKRARSCYDYLVKKGIAGSRMSHEGYGETQPIATNMNKAGRKQNRRVVFDIFLPK